MTIARLRNAVVAAKTYSSPNTAKMLAVMKKENNK